MARIGVDLDGVVINFIDSYREHLTGIKAFRCLPCPEPTHWDFYSDRDWGQFDETDFQWCLENHDEVFSDAKPYPGAIEALERLHKAGHNLVFITDREVNPRAKTITSKWLRDHLFRPFNVAYELHITADKASVPVDYFIDDKPENVEAMRQAEGVVMSILCKRPWNAVIDGMTRVPLEDFVDMVLEVEQITCKTEELTWKPPAEERVTSPTGGSKGRKQARIGSIDPLAIMAMAKVAGFGEEKYARLNYLNGYDWSLSYDACQRHLHAFWSGEDNDPESGLPHLAHAGWHCMAMLAFLIHQLGTDDRFKKPA